MNLRILFFIFLAFFYKESYTQHVSFNDPELKRYLVNTVCVDTAFEDWFSNDINPDVNQDGELSPQETSAVTHLEIQFNEGDYDVQSLNDLEHFPNLEYLIIFPMHGVKKLTNLNLPNLQTLWIFDDNDLEVIDLSNLPNLTNSIRLEGMLSLDTLNLKNGSAPENFSLFYTQNVKYACVDSIAFEYDAFALYGAMKQGDSPSINCTVNTGVSLYKGQGDLRIFPNPAQQFIQIKTEHPFDYYKIQSIDGSLVQKGNFNSKIDFKLPSGVYFLEVFENENLLARKKFVVQ